MDPSLPLLGRVALVTGANHGIGAAVARGLAARGADVAVTFLRLDPPTDDRLPDAYAEARRRGAHATVAEVEHLGRRAWAVEVDLRDPAAPGSVLAAVEDRLGPVSVLVHNASGWAADSFGSPADETRAPLVDLATVDGPLHVDARAGALLMAGFIARHRARGDRWGRIVTLTSGTGGAFPGEVSYGAAKAALVSYTLSAASEMAADGVTANVVHPPVTDTGWITDDVRRFVERDPEHHHVAAPDEVAEVVVWLCAEANHLVTGNVLRLR